MITEKKGGKALIVLPLGVRQEFARDARELLHMPEPEYVRTMAEVRAASGRILMTNYERVRDGILILHISRQPAWMKHQCFDPSGARPFRRSWNCLRASSISWSARQRRHQNKYKELIHYAGYLKSWTPGRRLPDFFSGTARKQIILPCTRINKMSFGFGFPAGRWLLQGHQNWDMTIQDMICRHWMSGSTRYGTATRR